MRSTIFRFPAALAWATLATTVAAAPPAGDGAPVWHPITITLTGPAASVTDCSPNPFLDYRLQVVFHGPSNQRFVVPGFFDGDGQGGPDGHVWRVRFAANAAGTWQYQASFRRGPGVAIQLEEDGGTALELPGLSGSLRVLPRASQAPGFLKWGRLDYVGKHYLKFQDGPYWIRGGTDSPENFLAYAGFDRTPPNHRYADHVSDWRQGDPDWGDGRGRGIIGAMNYLASRHVNSIYLLTMNVGGDGRDVWPWTSPIDPKGNPGNDNLHFDTGKLAQWEIVFAHAQRLGIMLHLVLGEAEDANKRELDNGELGPERKLYYRELIARFSHHLALQWNLCEEYNVGFDYGPARLRAFADYIRALDPYNHPITVHSAGDPVEQLRFTYGDARFDLTSIQLNQRPIHDITEAIYRETQEAGRPLNGGRWNGRQVLSEPLIEQCFRPGVAADLPRTSGKGEDYLAIGSYGGGTDQTPHGPGVYGFNLWFNRRVNSGALVWPGVPEDTYQANGMWNRDTVTVIPSLRMVAAVHGAKHDKFEPGNPANGFNQSMLLLVEAASADKLSAQ